MEKKKMYFLLLILLLIACSQKKILQFSPKVTALNFSHCKESNNTYLPINGAFSLTTKKSINDNYVVELNNNYSKDNYKITHYILFENEMKFDTINVYSHNNWEIPKETIEYGSFYLSKSDLQEIHQQAKNLTVGEFLDKVFQNGFFFYENKTKERYRIINDEKYRIVKSFKIPLKSTECEITYQADDCQ